MPPLMALRDAVGIERMVVDTYQAVAGTGHKAIVELEEQIRAHAEGRAEGRQRLPARHRLQRPPAHRRLPGQRVHEGGVEGRHREPQDPAPAGPARLVHGRPRARSSSATPRRSTSRPGTRSRRTAPASCSRPSRASWSRTTRRTTSTRSRPRPPGSDEVFVGRVRQDPSIPDDRGPRLLGRLGQPAQGRGVQRRGDRGGARGARLDPQGQRARGRGGVRGTPA